MHDLTPRLAALAAIYRPMSFIAGPAPYSRGLLDSGLLSFRLESAGIPVVAVGGAGVYCTLDPRQVWTDSLAAVLGPYTRLSDFLASPSCGAFLALRSMKIQQLWEQALDALVLQWIWDGHAADALLHPARFRFCCV